MIDVNAVMDGTFEPNNLDEALEASVLIARLQSRVDKGKSNVFGFVLVFARNIFAEWYEKRESLNDPESPWYAVAAAAFKEQAVAAATAAELRDYTEADLKLYKNAVRTLHRAMLNEAPLLERDDASGSFVLGGKSAIEQWNKKFQEEQDRAQHERDRAALLAAGGIRGVTDGDGEGAAETGPSDVLSLIESAALRSEVEEFILVLAELAGHTEKVKGSHGEENGLDKAFRVVKTAKTAGNKILTEDFTAVVNAAKEEARTGTNG